MTASIPYRLANGPGNIPDAIKWMANYDWLTSLVHGNSIANPDFESWLNGTSFTNPANGTAVASGWTWRKSGTSSATADVARESTTINTGTYSAKVSISVAGSSNSILAFDQNIANPSFFKSVSVVVGFAVKTSTASKVRVKVTDGITTAYSDYHSGGGSWETLRVKMAVGSSVSTLTVSLEITSDFTGDIYVDSSFNYVVPSLIDSSAQEALSFVAQIAGFLPTVGGSMFGNIAMSSNKLTGLGAGSSDGDSLRYEQRSIKQIVQGTTTTFTSATSTSYTDTGLSASITPSSTGSKILVLVSQTIGRDNDGTTQMSLDRGGSDLKVVAASFNNGTGGSVYSMICLAYLDSPASVSSLTYKTKMKNRTGAGTHTANGDGTASTDNLIQLIELAGV